MIVLSITVPLRVGLALRMSNFSTLTTMALNHSSSMSCLKPALVKRYTFLKYNEHMKYLFFIYFYRIVFSL